MASTYENLCVVGVGEMTGSVTAKQLPSIGGRFATIRAFPANANPVYIGGPSVTVPDGTTDAVAWSGGDGYPLQAGEAITLPLVDNLDELYLIGTAATDDIHILVEGLVSQR